MTSTSDNNLTCHISHSCITETQPTGEACEWYKYNPHCPLFRILHIPELTYHSEVSLPTVPDMDCKCLDYAESQAQCICIIRTPVNWLLMHELFVWGI